MKKLLLALLVFITAIGGYAAMAADDSKAHKVAIHVDENDPQRMNLALNNIANINRYYESVGEPVEIELVAYGPGLHMFRTDTSPVKDRLSVMSMEMENVTFSACANTQAAMSKREGNEVILVEEAQMVPSGVVQLISLQEQGYSYVRPQSSASTIRMTGFGHRVRGGTTVYCSSTQNQITLAIISAVV